MLFPSLGLLLLQCWLHVRREVVLFREYCLKCVGAGGILPFASSSFAVTVTVGWSERSVIGGSPNMREKAFSLAYEKVFMACIYEMLPSSNLTSCVYTYKENNNQVWGNAEAIRGFRKLRITQQSRMKCMLLKVIPMGRSHGKDIPAPQCGLRVVLTFWQRLLL